MKDQKWMPLVAVAVIGIGIGIGHWLPIGKGRSSSDSGEDEASRNLPRTTRASLRRDTGPTTPFERLRREIRAANPQQLPGLVSRTLEIADPAERLTALMEALKYADPSNVREIMGEFARITRETGRIQHDEWRKALFETGRSGGVEMLRAWKEEGKNSSSTEVWTTLYGVAFENPEGAMAWLNGPETADDHEKERLLPIVIGGAILNDPDTGLRMLAELPEKARRTCLGQLAWNLIQKEGMDSAVDRMLELRKSSVGTEPGYAQAVESEILNRLFMAAQWTGGAPEMANQLVKINAAAPINPDRLASTISRMPGTAGFDLIGHLAKNPAMARNEGIESAIAKVTRSVNQQSPQAVNSWLEQNASSPIAPQIRQVLGAPAGQ